VSKKQAGVFDYMLVVITAIIGGNSRYYHYLVDLRIVEY